jgi:cell division protein FtsQ
MGKEVKKKPTSADKKVQQLKKQQLAKEKEKAEKIKRIKEQKVKQAKEEKKKQLIEQEKIRKEQEKEEKRLQREAQLNDPEFQRKRKKRKKKIIVFVVFFGIIVTLLGVACSPIFSIKNVEIVGNDHVSETEIRNLLNIKEGDNLFLTFNFVVRKRLEPNAYIKDVNVRRKLPDTLTVEVKERKIEFVFAKEDTYYFFDKDGKFLEKSTQPIIGKIEIKGYKTEVDKLEINDTFSNEDLKKLEDIKEIIKAAEKQNIADMITYIDISSTKNNVFFLQTENKTVYVGNTDQLEYKMIFLKTILEKEKGNSGEVHLEEIDSNKDPFFRQNI